jgi:hypothetical protein
VEKLIKTFGNLRIYLYICIMSLTKRWIEQQMESGVDVLHPEYQHSDDEYHYEKYLATKENENGG